MLSSKTQEQLILCGSLGQIWSLLIRLAEIVLVVPQLAASTLGNLQLLFRVMEGCGSGAHYAEVFYLLPSPSQEDADAQSCLRLFFIYQGALQVAGDGL